MNRRTLLALTGVGAVSVLTACADGASPSAERTSRRSTATDTTTDTTTDTDSTTDPLAMTVYKDPSCGCCDGWIEHVEEHGFATTTEHPSSLASVWQRHDVPLDLQSCHLARTEDGHLFVGHVPARHVREYLADPPKGARGLSVPAMPVGTPGMEQGERFDPYSVMLITDGEPRVFATVQTASDQRA